MDNYKIRIKGVSDYLQNQMTTDKDQIAGIKSKIAGDDTDLKAQVEKKMYRDEKGCYIPAKHIEGSLVKSAAEYPMKGRKKWTEFFKGLVVVNEREIRFIPPKDKPDTVYGDIVKNPSTRGRFYTERPMFCIGWEVEFTLQILDEKGPSEKLLHEILNTAGKYKGIGDYRPKFGRFEVVEFEKIEE